MSVADLLDLIRAIAAEFETFDGVAVTTTAPVEAPVEVGRRYETGVSLRDLGADPIDIIKAVREITDSGLREVQELLEATHSVVPDGDHDSADGPEPAGVPAKPKRPSPPRWPYGCLLRNVRVMQPDARRTMGQILSSRALLRYVKPTCWRVKTRRFTTLPVHPSVQITPSPSDSVAAKEGRETCVSTDESQPEVSPVGYSTVRA